MRSALDLARLLGSPPPTPQQIEVIEAPLEPMLVVAGAGSGKTATMTDRVVYLVANGFVAPSEVLGLTFTRKAASELASRIERSLRRLAHLDAADAARSDVDPAADSAHLDVADRLTERPRISTYNAYAAGLVADHGVRIGIESDTSLLGEAGRYQLAQRLVETWRGDLPARLQEALHGRRRRGRPRGGDGRAPAEAAASAGPVAVDRP